ncbi:hypothetical protein E4T44_04277 [Aureobasidium sp. EXF-8845]|nr:hypothetical protein E4T44_04277 [Aureobasidium sp. EXF-8845]KAI4853679.1 hypothetical protein E4T45_04237 [Aureobasidium sp. EXF-8846]
MAYTTRDPHMADTMEMIRRLATLETELRIEREQHALAQQCITHMAQQLATRNQRSATPVSRDENETCGRRLERYDREVEDRIRPEIKAEPRNEGRREQMGKQKVEEDDLITWDDEVEPVDSVHSPSLIPCNRHPTPTEPRSEQTFRAKCLAFLKQDEARHEPIDNSKDKQSTLLTFENSGDVCSENMLPSNSSDVQPPSHSHDQNTKRSRFLTLKSLSDRYQDQTPTDQGISSSQWAGPEKKIMLPEVQEDLMQFPETDEVSENTAVEPSENALTEEQLEEAKQKYAAELRKNQALIMYDPAPSEDAFRTVLVTDIPTGKSETDVMRTVSGGMIVKVQSMNTQLMKIAPVINSKTMLITFLQARDARKFLESVKDKTEPKFSLLRTPTYPINGYLADDMMYNGITRCLAVHDLHDDITLESLCRATKSCGSKRDSVIDANRDEQGACHLEFASVLAAVAGRWNLKDNLFRRYTRAVHEADPCDRKIIGIADGEGEKEEHRVEEGELEEGEIDESDDGTGIDSETQAGAEPESKSSSGEKDADGWPVGGLDYD